MHAPLTRQPAPAPSAPPRPRRFLALRPTQRIDEVFQAHLTLEALAGQPAKTELRLVLTPETSPAEAVAAATP